MEKVILAFIIILAISVLMMSPTCGPVPESEEPKDVVLLPDSLRLTMMLCGMRDDSTHFSNRDGIWHAYVVGDTTPRWWGFISRNNHVLVFNPMTGVPPITLSDTTRIVVEIVNTRGKP